MINHLTEEERQGVADGSLEPGAHLRACAECSADVERIRRLMKRVDEAKARESSSPGELEQAWGEIRARIEKDKVVVMPVRESRSAGGREGRRSMWVAGGLIAAGVMALWLTRGRPVRIDPNPADSGIVLVALADSANAYQEEAQALLNHFEVQRATLRPELAFAFERDLKAIDVAIAELQGAIKNDPANPALRRLLASSYRQKVDLLKRVSHAAG